MKTYIYTLSDNTGVRYIGKSDVPELRMKDHLKEAKRKRTRKEKWIFSLIESGELPKLEILDIVPLDMWCYFEIYWITQFKAWGFDIVNGTDGGEGSNGFKGKRHTEETKEKCRVAAKKRQSKTRLCGSSNGRSKLTEDQVKEIKKKLFEGVSHANIAREYSISKTSITLIANGKRWKHIIHAG